jgi:predicted HTH domain antitoxin
LEISVRIPDKIKAHLKEPYDKSVNETLVVEMYREGLFTLRQAAEILGVDINEMNNVLSRRKTYINFGTEELNEDISYARS